MKKICIAAAIGCLCAGACAAITIRKARMAALMEADRLAAMEALADELEEELTEEEAAL